MGYAPIRMETRAGKPVQSGGRKITPFSQALIVNVPGAPAGIVWNRPVSVLVQQTDGSASMIPVVDYTRQVELALLGIVAGFTLFLVAYRILFARK